MPRRSRRLNPPCLLDGLSDDLVLRMFSRAPFMTHGTLHVVCRRLKTLLRSPEFLQLGAIQEVVVLLVRVFPALQSRGASYDVDAGLY